MIPSQIVVSVRAGGELALPIGLYFVYYLFMASSISDIPKKRGRPATGKDPMLTFRAPPQVSAALDAASAEMGGSASRSELIRRIVVEWLSAKGHLK